MQRVAPSPSVRPGFTLIELLVAIAIMAVLMAMTLPALHSAREAARKSTCQQKLSQLGTAFHAYHDSFGSFPAGTVNNTTPIRFEPTGYHHNWVVALLPYLGEDLLAGKIDPALSIYDEAQLPARQYMLPNVICPSDSAPNASTSELGSVGLSNYAGVHDSRIVPIDEHNNGLLFQNRQIALDDIPDGAGYTLLLGEILRRPDDLGWASGTNATIRNTGASLNGVRQTSISEVAEDVESVEEAPGSEAPPVRPPVAPLPDLSNSAPGGFSSSHGGVVQFLYADGQVKAMSEHIDNLVLRRLTERSDNVIASP
ncbi:MAG: DUF1559 domain-containing protein [Planctomycetaceae bacterium]